MRRPKYLQWHRNEWRVAIRVPSYLVEAIGRVVLSRNLGGDYEVALAKRLDAVRALQEQISAAHRSYEKGRRTPGGRAIHPAERAIKAKPPKPMEKPQVRGVGPEAEALAQVEALLSRGADAGPERRVQPLDADEMRLIRMGLLEYAQACLRHADPKVRMPDVAIACLALREKFV